LSTSPHHAVTPTMGKAVACSNESAVGFTTTNFSSATNLSANAPPDFMGIVPSTCGSSGQVVARDVGDTFVPEAAQDTVAQRHLHLLRHRFGVIVHAQDRPGRRSLDQLLLCGPVGFAHFGQGGLSGPGRRYQEEMLDASLAGRINGATSARRPREI